MSSIGIIEIIKISDITSEEGRQYSASDNNKDPKVLVVKLQKASFILWK